MHLYVGIKNLTAHQHANDMESPFKNRNSMRAGQMSMRSGQIIAFIRSLWPANEGIRFYAGYNRPMQIDERAQYNQLFPNCQIMPNIMENLLNGNQTPHFYVRKSFKVTQLFPPTLAPKKAVIYLATLDDLENNVNSYEDFTFYFRTSRHWLSFSACSNDQIVSLKTNDQVRLSDGRIVSAKNCGLASLLAYLCFLDVDHLTDGKGFSIDNDPHWQDGNMPAISAMPLNFNNRGCSKIIRADSYEQMVFQTSPQTNQGRRHSLFGHKALIYGATAAHFYAMVSYNQSPCRRPPGRPCCMANGDKGNCFDTTDLVDSINVHDPKPLIASADVNSQSYLEMEDFLKHYGTFWYFCRR